MPKTGDSFIVSLTPHSSMGNMTEILLTEHLFKEKDILQSPEIMLLHIKYTIQKTRLLDLDIMSL